MRHAASSADHVRVIHSIADWLPRTATWLYTEVKSLPGSVQSRVVCDQRTDVDAFGDLDIAVLTDEGSIRTLWDKGLRRLGIRDFTGFLRGQLRAFDADVLHSHFGYTGWANRRCARAAGVGHVVSFYGFDIQQVPRSDHRWYHRYERLFDEVDLVLCEGPFMAGSLERLGCAADKIRVHHLGVPVDRIPFQLRRLTQGERLRVLLAGTFREKKGHVDALEAVAQLRQRGIGVQVTLVGEATGSAGDQREKSRIDAVIARHGLEDCVTRTGFLEHERLLAASYDHHVFVAPSVTAADGDSEGGAPVLLTEMAATGIVLVGTSHCDIPNVIQDGTTGYLVPERQPTQLADALARAVREDADWSRLARNARRRVECEFNAETQGVRLAALYESVRP